MRYTYLTLLAVLCMVVSARAADTAGKAKKQVTGAIQTRQQIQRGEDAWEAERIRFQAEFDSLQAANGQLEEENRDLLVRLKSRRRAIGAMEQEIQALQRISGELSPYLNKLLSRFSERVNEGLPFSQVQRRQRMARLARQLDDAGLSIGVKFRNLTEALLIEARYGNSVEVTTRQIELREQPIMVRVLRLGRLGLFFLTLDHKTAGLYDPATASWKPLPTGYGEDILKAIQIGSKQRSVELLSLPLGRIVPQ